MDGMDDMEDMEDMAEEAAALSGAGAAIPSSGQGQWSAARPSVVRSWALQQEGDALVNEK